MALKEKADSRILLRKESKKVYTSHNKTYLNNWIETLMFWDPLHLQVPNFNVHMKQPGILLKHRFCVT